MRYTQIPALLSACALALFTAFPSLVLAEVLEAKADVPEKPPVPLSDDSAPEVQNVDAKFQSTYVWQEHPGFSAAYSGPNSLSAEREPRSYTWSATAFLGTRVWSGGEVYFNPEMISSQSLSGLHGLGAFTNGENQKGGGPDPTFYAARLFLRQTWNLGGGTDKLESAPNQLAGTADRHRVVLTVGKISLTDIFDNNSYSHDARSQFLNWTLMTNGAFDYAADARGYTSGAAVEYYRDAWVVRAGRFEQPAESNGLALDSRLLKHYGDQVEVEHQHEVAGQPGKLRLLAFHNRAFMGGFQDALDAWRADGKAGVPDVAAVRKERSKLGWGLNLEQAITGDVGTFLRASWNDGQSETYAFTEVERSVSGGVSIKGTAWARPDDVFGLGLVQDGLSAEHREYLANGGLGAFIGDGLPPAGMTYDYAPERLAEAFYNAKVARGTWASLDFQRAQNPAYNADRGPVNIFGARMHVEY